MKQYTVVFESVSFCDWIVEANSLEEAQELANNIDDNGTFSDERTESYEQIDIYLE